ncbi:MAG: DUF6695 family protein [Vicingaceae bacterium]
MRIKGTIIALAWPNTKVVCEGKWYDEPMRWVGALKNGYYNAGHAAFILINNNNGEAQYFDFGRYHTPIKYGRVRSKLTDPDVELKYNAIIENGVITNLEEILLERYHNKACHGDGKLTAAIVTCIDYEKAFNKVLAMQNREAIPYGPFEFKGTTCSRFVAQTVLYSTKNWLTKLMILLPYTVSATPRSNNKVLNDCPYYYEVVNDKIQMKKSAFYWFKKMLVSEGNSEIKVSAMNLSKANMKWRN